MDNKSKAVGGVIGSIFSLIGLSVSTGELEQIISIICAVAGFLWTITITGVIPLIKWWKKAKKDGKITEDEITEAEDILNNVKTSTDDIKNNKEGKE